MFDFMQKYKDSSYYARKWFYLFSLSE